MTAHMTMEELRVKGYTVVDGKAVSVIKMYKPRGGITPNTDPGFSVTFKSVPYGTPEDPPKVWRYTEALCSSPVPLPWPAPGVPELAPKGGGPNETDECLKLLRALGCAPSYNLTKRRRSGLPFGMPDLCGFLPGSRGWFWVSVSSGTSKSLGGRFRCRPRKQCGEIAVECDSKWTGF